jgi:hypothetical protein
MARIIGAVIVGSRLWKCEHICKGRISGLLVIRAGFHNGSDKGSEVCSPRDLAISMPRR